MLLIPSSTDLDLSQLKMKNYTDVPTELVNHVPHNVLLVPNPLTIVTIVSKEELTLQNVTVQLVNTLTLTTNVKTVTSNVKLVPHTINVSNVLNKLTDLPQKNVSVKMDSMKLTLLSVQLVTIIVLNVLHTQVVTNVPLTDLFSQIVYVTTTGMMKPVFVKNVLINVMDVTNILIIVYGVLVKTELMPQPVTVLKVTSKMVSVKLVQNVPVNVTPVLIMVTIV